MSHKTCFPVLLLSALAFLLLASAEARACSCGGRQTVLDAYERADIVVIVSAVSVEKAPPDKTAPKGRMSDGRDYVDGVMSTAMRVERVFKGGLKVGDEMRFGQGGGADCIWTFDENDIGKKFLFYLNRYDDGVPLWYAVTCGRSRRVEFAGDDLLYLDKLDKTRGRTRLSGTLFFDRNEGQGVAGRKIRVVGAGKTHEVKTDDGGVYEIYDLPAGKYTVEPEIPPGWRVAEFWLRYSPSFAGLEESKSPKKIPVVVEDKKHAGLDLHFEIDNAIRGKIFDTSGRPMNGVCLDLVPADGSKGPYLADCTEREGAFEIDEIPTGRYVIVVNDDGEVTSSEPFKTFYYPNAARREEATVFEVGPGDFLEDVQIYVPRMEETVTVEGVLLFSDGKPVADERVEFRSEGAGRDDDDTDAQATTDSKGHFSIKILKGQRGRLYGEMFTYAGEFENCPKLDAVIKKIGNTIADIKTPAVEINAAANVYGVELRYPFPGCKKAKID